MSLVSLDRRIAWAQTGSHAQLGPTDPAECELRSGTK